MLFTFEQVLCISILQCIEFRGLKTYIQQKHQQKQHQALRKYGI